MFHLLSWIVELASVEQFAVEAEPVKHHSAGAIPAESRSAANFHHPKSFLEHHNTV